MKGKRSFKIMALLIIAVMLIWQHALAAAPTTITAAAQQATTAATLAVRARTTRATQARVRAIRRRRSLRR